MPESWYPFFEWCEGTLLGTAVRDSIYAFPLIEATHLVALCVMGGALILVDLRLLGLGLRTQGIAELADQVRPWLVAAVAVMLSTGVLLFLSEAVKCFYNTAFGVKMLTLPVALAYTFAVRARLLQGLQTGLRSRVLGAVSLALWFVVAAAGRWIGFS